MPQGPSQYPAYVAESPSPSGVKAFYTLLKMNFSQVEVWKKPTQALPTSNSHQLMILVEPASALTDREIKQLIVWMEAGNRVLLASKDPQRLFDLHTQHTGASNGTSSIVGYEGWKGSYQAEVGTGERLVPGPQDQILLRDQTGVISLSRKYGQGELMVLLAPAWLSNAEIQKQDHLRLLLPYISRAEPKVIWFNDFIHGYSKLPTVLGVYPAWFLVLLSQISLTLLFWLWYKGKRFGPVRAPRAELVRFEDERIRAVAAWYERGRFYQESLEIQAEYLRQAVQKRWGIPASLQEQEFLDTATYHLPPDKQQHWLQMWQEVQAFSAKKLSQQAYIKYSRLFDVLLKEVEQ